MTDKPTPLSTMPERKKRFGLRHSALVEMSLALGLLLAAGVIWHDHNRFWSANPHPFWFVVLFIAGKYGTREGLAAALLASIALLFGNLPVQLVSQDAYAYAFFVAKLPILWLASAVLFGELRQMHIHERNRLEEAVREAEKREHRIAESYQKVKDIKYQLELRLAGQLRSSIAIYHAARSMESLQPGEVLSGLESLVSAVMNPDQFSIYTLGEGGLNIALRHGWKKDDAYAGRIAVSSPLYRAIVAEQKVLCVASAAQERILAGDGILAGPLADRMTGEVIGMLKIEKIGFSDLNVSSLEAFSTLCEWAALAIINARKYQQSRESGLINPDNRLFSTHYLKHYTDHMSALASRAGFDLAMLTIRLKDAARFDAATRLHISGILANAAHVALRHIDMAFEQQAEGDAYSILLPVTPRAGAEIVLKKIRDALASHTDGITGGQPEFSFNIEMIYEKSER
ncbi:MAG: GAF domain-containing protein [Pseudomonadota bacterium]|nr:GAF domain-containing protein [Pseudomonadota bacterium]